MENYAKVAPYEKDTPKYFSYEQEGCIVSFEEYHYHCSNNQDNVNQENPQPFSPSNTIKLINRLPLHKANVIYENPTASEKNPTIYCHCAGKE
jgi:hypothetical protein